jgi:hypothetical protein
MNKVYLLWIRNEKEPCVFFLGCYTEKWNLLTSGEKEPPLRERDIPRPLAKAPKSLLLEGERRSCGPFTGDRRVCGRTGSGRLLSPWAEPTNQDGNVLRRYPHSLHGYLARMSFHTHPGHVFLKASLLF